MLAIVAMAASMLTPPQPPKRSEFYFWSIGVVSERDHEERELSGLSFRYVGYWDDHAPPITFYWGGEALRGDDQEVLRGSGTFSILAFRAGPYASFWFRPSAGVEFRTEAPDNGLGVLATLGGEFIVRPKVWLQVAVTADRIFSTLGTYTQVGLAFRWGRKEP